jgi:hypothetical protein
MITIRNNIYKKCLGMMGIVLTVCIASLCEAGNKGMVKSRIRELDGINKNAVSKIPNIPQNGKISIRGHIYPEGESAVQYKVYDRKMETVTKGIIHFTEPVENSPVFIKKQAYE